MHLAQRVLQLRMGSHVQRQVRTYAPATRARPLPCTSLCPSVPLQTFGALLGLQLTLPLFGFPQAESRQRRSICLANRQHGVQCFDRSTTLEHDFLVHKQVKECHL